MGVDLSVDVVVGFVVDPHVKSAYVEANEDDDNGEWELFASLVEDQPLLQHGTAGSFYDDGENNREWIGVNRLTRGYDTHDIPGGVIGLAKPTITLAEREALLSVAAKVGQVDPEIGQFMSVLWH